jgi:hypothetical protein
MNDNYHYLVLDLIPHNYSSFITTFNNKKFYKFQIITKAFNLFFIIIVFLTKSQSYEICYFHFNCLCDKL